MHIHKPQKIDLEQIYPCPCPRKRGKLKPIALTDAFGCDRCSLLFELEDDGYSLLQLGGIDSQRHTWQWVGRWQAIREYNQYSVLELALIHFTTYLAGFLFLSFAILWMLNLKLILSIPVILLLGLLIWRAIICAASP